MFRSTDGLFRSSSSSQSELQRLNSGSENNDFNIIEQFRSIVSKVSVMGLPCNQMPTGSNMVKMLNISSFFKKFGYADEYYESLFLTGLTMVSSRKYVQSVEFFRQIQKHIFNTLHDIPDEISKIDWNIVDPYSSGRISQPEMDLQSITSSVMLQNTQALEVKFRPLIKKAAKLDILIADCCSQHSQIQEKIDAFKHATLLYRID